MRYLKRDELQIIKVNKLTERVDIEYLMAIYKNCKMSIFFFEDERGLFGVISMGDILNSVKRDRTVSQSTNILHMLSWSNHHIKQGRY